jgi:hypothetical protein
VASISNIPVMSATGYLHDTSLCVTPVPVLREETPGFRSRVTVQRNGEIQVPLDIVITWTDGTVVNESWDGTGRVKEFEYTGTSKILSAEIDPERKIYIDYNFVNNSRSIKRSQTGYRYFITEYMTAVQHFLESISLLM